MRGQMMSSDILVAKHSFSTEINGVPRVVTKGETFREGHVVIDGREELFEPFSVDNEIEQATAAPGEKRRTRRKEKSEKKAEQATAAPGESAEASASTEEPAAEVSDSTGTEK
jgi:hypothetical protein